VLFSESALKATHFIELCNQRGVPLIFLQNITGFIVGSKYERAGIAKDGAKLVHAVANSVVPKFTVVIGGSFGAGNYGMCGRPSSRAAVDVAERADLGHGRAAGGVGAHDRETRAAGARGQAVPGGRGSRDPPADPRQVRARGIAVLLHGRLWDDGILDPADTRQALALGLSAAFNAPIPEPKFGVFRM
jgi:3-methylcrotonyl-CoA carboxylase beta subunit